jgi:ketosteroid isomerase-like protein
MNRPQCLALVPAVFVLLLGPSALGQENPSNDEAMKVFRQEAERYVTAFNAHDAAALTAQHAPNVEAVLIVGDQVRRQKGRAETQEFFAQTFSQSPNLKLKLTPESARMVAHEVIVGDGIWELTGVSATGPTKGRYISVRKKMDGQWQIVSNYRFSPQSSSAD